MLPEYRQARVYTEYVVGEVVADFLDDDSSDDIVTSGRQRVQQDDPRYLAVRKVVNEGLRQMRDEWDSKRKRKGTERALEYQSVQRWYSRMGPDKRRTAERMFGKIEALRLGRGGTQIPTLSCLYAGIREAGPERHAQRPGGLGP